MKTISEIRKDIVSFYSTIQQRVTDFSFGSVISGIFYSVSSALERIYIEIQRVERQAYIATATGQYLDRLIEGTFQLQRKPATRSVGYITIYANSPLANDVLLRYAEFDDENNEFLGNTNFATKFLARNVLGDEALSFVLIQPESNVESDFIDTENKTITLPEGNQYAVLRVAAQQTGEVTNIQEGALSDFPTKPNGISGVINTLNPGFIFFSNEEYTGGAPYSTRFTTVRNYIEDVGNFSVDNAFNFSSDGGVVEITRDALNTPVNATYVASDDSTFEGGLIFDYIEANLSTISLKQPIINSENILPSVTIFLEQEEEEKTYNLKQFSYDEINIDLDEITGTIYEINIDGVGTEYDSANPPAVSIVGGGGSGATAVATVNDVGNLESIQITNPGSGYVTVPDVVIEDPPVSGVTATATAVLGGTETFLSELSNFLSVTPALIINERRRVLSDDVIIDFDRKLTENYDLPSSTAISGGSDASTDNEYRNQLISYLNSLGRSTRESLVAGSLQINGVEFASVLPSYLSLPGSSVVIASDEDGFLSELKRREVKKELDEEWKAAGINLIVRPPERYDTHVSMSVKLLPGAVKEIVNSDIIDATEAYFSELTPGQRISYSDLLNILDNLPGVENVFNLIITKDLTDEIYSFYKENYDEGFVTDLTNTKISSIDFEGKPTSPKQYQLIYDSINDSYFVYHPEASSSDGDGWVDVGSDAFISDNVGQLFTYDSFNENIKVYGDSTEANGPISSYNLLNFINQFIDLGILWADNENEFLQGYEHKDSVTIYNFVLSIVGRLGVSEGVKSTSELREVIDRFKDELPVTDIEFYYALSYLFSEPIDKSQISLYPIKPELVKSSNIQDYFAEPYEIYKLDTFTFNNVVSSSIGVNYL